MSIAVFVIAVFVIAPDRKQPMCLSMGDWLHHPLKVWYIHTMEYYSAIKVGSRRPIRLLED